MTIILIYHCNVFKKNRINYANINFYLSATFYNITRYSPTFKYGLRTSDIAVKTSGKNIEIVHSGTRNRYSKDLKL